MQAPGPESGSQSTWERWSESGFESSLPLCKCNQSGFNGAYNSVSHALRFVCVFRGSYVHVILLFVKEYNNYSYVKTSIPCFTHFFIYSLSVVCGRFLNSTPVLQRNISLRSI